MNIISFKANGGGFVLQTPLSGMVVATFEFRFPLIKRILYVLYMY